MAFTKGEKESRRKYPVTTGLDLDQKHEGRQSNLVPEKGSNVPQRESVGL